MTKWHLGRSATEDELAETSRAGSHRYMEMRNVSLVGLVTNALLSASKLVLGWIAQSQALMADGVHSLADGLTDAAVILTARFSTQAADETHPYGHQRIETVATAGLGLVLVLTGLGIMVDASQRLLDPSRLFHPSELALAGAFVSIVVNEALYQYTRHKGRLIGSPLLLANAWHHRTDALSSVAVLFGVGGVLLGWQSLDAVAAMVVALMIIRVGWQQLGNAFSELVDSGLSSEQIEKIIGVINQIEGVSNPHRLRTRKMGEQVLMDVHVEVPKRISVSEGHQLAETVQAQLKELVVEVSDVVVHIDPKDQKAVWLELPDRKTVLEDFFACWRLSLTEDDLLGFESATLHYLDGAIEVEVIWVLPKNASVEDAHRIKQLTENAVETLDYVAGLTTLFKLA
jgi:cation diffusion facilitator family transporter